MENVDHFLLGEFVRTLDDRFRVSIPQELLAPLAASGTSFVLAKQRAGCLSLWPAENWRAHVEPSVDLVRRKMLAGKLNSQLGKVQRLGRLLSTAQREVQIAGKGRLLVPEGFRDFLRAEPGGDVVLVGAAVCLEIWHPDAWRRYVQRSMPKFRRLLDELSA